ncbi:Protein phosphatase inhibitor 2 (IPP-2) [Gracilaria domingensis]|nr:Protein phosphatase inhibitor 2 (IPP-2) [Gracilaria domingensis]
MTDPNPPPSANTDPEELQSSSSTMPEPNPRPSQPSLSEAPKKKSRLHWDEQNLISNALEMERNGPRMKIDEPKTPFVASETGSSTSGSAHQSPPESPSFIPGERLVGFQSLENSMPKNGPLSSDGASSAGSTGRSVQIKDGSVLSGGSSPRSKEEFEARRKAHYRNEARVSLELWRNKMLKEDEEFDSEDSGDCNGTEDNKELRPNGVPAPKLNGGSSRSSDSEEESGTSLLEPNGKLHSDSSAINQQHPE